MLMAIAIFCLALDADNVFGTTGGKDPHARRLPDVLITPCATKPGKHRQTSALALLSTSIDRISDI